MEKENEATTISLLRSEVERRIGFQLSTPKDFETLMDRLPKEEPLSMSTLKRMWQYVHSEHMPRESTLSVLARFAGYNDWAHFCREHDDWSDSGFLSTINVETDMSVGEEITLTWKPDRSLRIRHLSGTRFEVLDATHCKLQRGDTFCASWISNGCPLLATRVMRASLSLPDYIAGKKEGIRIVEEVTKAEP